MDEDTIMEVAKIILEYLKALAWPALVVYLALRYRRHLDALIRRLSEDADEIEAKFLGLSAKFRRDLKAISNDKDIAGAQARNAIQSRVEHLAVEQVRLLARNFSAHSLSMRQQIVREVKALAPQISIAQVLTLRNSPSTGERVAAGTILGEHVTFNPALAEDPDVMDMTREGLLDPSSFVRYRYARAVARSSELGERLQEFIKSLVKDEDDKAVKKELKALLGVA
jgi:polyhydroxyalkanoate synthesis regulator phasin